VVLAHAAEVAPIPDGLDFAAAASLPLAGLTALQALRDLAHVGPGVRVVVNGGAGGVGTLAIQIAAAMGAEVTSISSERNRDLCRGLGASVALAHDGAFRGPGPGPLAGGTWDVFFDVFGNRSLAAVREHLAPDGVYISTVPSVATLLDALLTRFSSRRARPILVRPSRSDLHELGALWQAGKLTPVIDRVVALADVPDAFRHLETKRARGKMVVEVIPRPGGE
jgi:NADPH:quinone reductase-like Zn-dependent oxidoreductase